MTNTTQTEATMTAAARKFFDGATVTDKETTMTTETQTMTQDQARRIVGRVLSMPRASDRIRPLIEEWRDLSARGAVDNAGQVARTIDDLAGHRDGAAWVGYALIAEAFRIYRP